MSKSFRNQTTRVGFIFNDVYTNTCRLTIERMQSDPQFDVRIFVSDQLDLKGKVTKPASLIQSELAKSLSSTSSSIIRNFSDVDVDYLFYMSPYDEYRYAAISSREAARRFRVLNISYGASLLRWDGELEFLRYNPFYANCRAVFVETSLIFGDARRFVAVGLTKTESVELGGAKASAIGRLAWRPRWSPGALNELSAQVTLVSELLAFDSKVEVVFFCHPFLIKTLADHNRDDLITALRHLQANIRFSVVDGANYVDQLAICNVYLGGVSSAVAEFMSSGGAVYIVGDRERLNVAGSTLLKSVKFLNSESSILNARSSLSVDLTAEPVISEDYYVAFPPLGSSPSNEIVRFIKEDVVFRKELRGELLSRQFVGFFIRGKLSILKRAIRRSARLAAGYLPRRVRDRARSALSGIIGRAV